ncbi:hypothetical protein LAZ67_13002518 [Cordylochernes scorpioides]|uniref:Mos1 transposase HTH domain-containing protein n=1 Tax=Cordylochernes scorpioides TaxID=51811 RepID=A0ABY6L5K4_9ARAC|nr:hypothetical protein LAZ67_13002518 [Cordylochernes scorpioides]
MDIKNVRKWCREFNEGRINVHDEQRSGRPSLPESTVARIDEMVRANRRITLEEIEDGLTEDCSHFSVHKIVSETLGYRKVSARWVDKWLKEAAGEWYNTGITKTFPVILGRSVAVWQPFAMELPLSSPTKCELRSVIRFLNAKNNSPVKIHRQLVEVYGEKCMDIKNVREWCREFNEGRINVHDEQRSGRPSLPESTVARIDEMVRANRRITLEEIKDGLNEDCSRFSVHNIVSETLGYRKVSARWVDKWLKEAAGEWYNTGITKLVDRMKKVIEHQGDYVEK